MSNRFRPYPSALLAYQQVFLIGELVYILEAFLDIGNVHTKLLLLLLLLSFPHTFSTTKRAVADGDMSNISVDCVKEGQR